MKWHIPIPYLPPLKFPLTPIKGAGHEPLCPLAVPVTVVQPGFVNGGPKRGSEATERGEGVGGGFPPPTVGRRKKKIVYENGIFLHIKCHC